MEGKRNLAMLTVIRFSSRSIVILPNSRSHHSKTDLEAWQAVKPSRRHASEIFPSTLRNKQTFWAVESLIRDIGTLRMESFPKDWIHLMLIKWMLTAAEMQ